VCGTTRLWRREGAVTWQSPISPQMFLQAGVLEALTTLSEADSWRCSCSEPKALPKKKSRGGRPSTDLQKSSHHSLIQELCSDDRSSFPIRTRRIVPSLACDIVITDSALRHARSAWLLVQRSTAVFRRCSDMDSSPAPGKDTPSPTPASANTAPGAGHDPRNTTLRKP